MSRLVMVGLNHRTASLALREKLHFSAQQIPELLDQLLKSCQTVGEDEHIELAVLSTCNRTEVYIATSNSQTAAKAVTAYITERAGPVPNDELHNHLEYYFDDGVVTHVMRVAAGLDSLVAGENEILGQVKDAFGLAQQVRVCGPILSALFRQAIRCGKRARAETEIGCLQRSVATVVVELAKELSPNLEHHCALLIGAGKISAMTARALSKAGLRFIMVTNRTFERAQKLAAAYGGQAVHFDALATSLAAADIVICSTGAPHVVLHANMVAETMKSRPERPMLIADLAVPRDADPLITGIPNVNLVDVDGLQQIALERPLAAAVHECIECIAAEEGAAFLEWFGARRRATVIARLHKKAGTVCGDQVEKTARRLGLNDPDQRAALHAMADAIASQLLHAPISFIKDGRQHGEDCEDLMQSIFDL